MKDIINNTIYDSDKSELIGETPPHWIGTSDGGGLYTQERLYRTKSGKFFIMIRYPRAPGIIGFLETGGFHSDWEIEICRKERAIEMIYKNGWDFKKAKLKVPKAA